MSNGVWSREEHDRFLDAIKLYPQGPWRHITEYIGTRSVRQVQTHAQKYHEKVVRRMRGLHKDRKAVTAREEHRIDAETLEVCKVGEGYGIIKPSPRSMTPGSSPSHHQTTAGDQDLEIATFAGELPTFDESLDFLIARLSEEIQFSEDDENEFLLAGLDLSF
ncbi:Myb domain-contaning protein, partial [Globisporangium splendens]